MILKSHVRDCLVLNWAIPHSTLPLPPAPLRYEVHSSGGRDWVFASALAFQHEGVHAARCPWLRVGHPQMNVRLYVIDEEGVPSVLFRRMFVPFWAAPGLRFAVGAVVRAARLDLPNSPAAVESGALWRVRGAGELEVATRLGSAAATEGPRLGGFERTVEILQNRPRGYAVGSRGLVMVGARHPSVAAIPVAAEVRQRSLLDALFPSPLPPLHSCWLAPDTPFEFDLNPVASEALPSALPQPAASRSAL